jgi:hypothetical protein
MKSKINRRAFMKGAAIAGGAIVTTEPLRLLTPGLAATSTRLLSYDRVVRELLARMTLDEKIGQMTQAEQSALREGDLQI